MEVKAAMEARTSIRSYVPEPVPVEDLRDMVRLAGLAPSLNNAQPWKYIAVCDGDRCQRLASLVRDKLRTILPVPKTDAQQRAASRLHEYVDLFGRAPALLVVATRTYPGFLDDALMAAGLTKEAADALRGRPYAMSLGASIQSLLLAATDLGYGACWLTAPQVAAPAIEMEVGIKSPWKLGAIVSVGKPAKEAIQSAKKPIDDIFEVLT